MNDTHIKRSKRKWTLGNAYVVMSLVHGSKSGKLTHSFERQHVDYLWGGGRGNSREQMLVSEIPLLV